MKPDDKLKAWKSESALDRVEGCMQLLYYHDFLTEAEKNKVRDRINKWIRRSQFKLTAGATP